MIQGPVVAPEVVYAIHNFEVENDDEIAFSIGEPVIVLEGDDDFHDGWWQVSSLAIPNRAMNSLTRRRAGSQCQRRGRPLSRQLHFPGGTD